MLATSLNQVGQSRPYSTLFLLFKTCNIARRIEIGSILLGLFHMITEWCIKYGTIVPHDNRMVHKIWNDKTTGKLLQSSK